jgi:hypothetical protein
MVSHAVRGVAPSPLPSPSIPRRAVDNARAKALMVRSHDAAHIPHPIGSHVGAPAKCPLAAPPRDRAPSGDALLAVRERTFTDAAAALLVSHEVRAADGEPPPVVAARACEELVLHLATFVGESGARALFDRSLVVVRARYPRLSEARAAAAEAPWPVLRAQLEAHGPAARDAAVALVAALLALFANLIGASLAQRILAQHRPEVFPLDVFKETP